MDGEEVVTVIPSAPRGPEDTGRILRWAGIIYGALLGTGYGWMAWVGGGWAAARRGLVGPNPFEALALGVVVGGVIVLVSEMLARYWSTARALEAEFRAILGPLAVIDCVLLATLSALGEEIFFRGGLQGWLLTVVSPAWSLTLTALLFGLMHFPMKPVFYWWTVFAILMGFLFGWLARVEGGLVAPIVVHAVVNGGNLWRMTRSRSPTGR